MATGCRECVASTTPALLRRTANIKTGRVVPTGPRRPIRSVGMTEKGPPGMPVALVSCGVPAA
jgi:hypothetical protein